LNNKFYFDKDDKEIVISEGSYNIRDINKYLRRAILQFYPNGVAREKTLRKEDEQYSLIIHVNNNTMKSEIKCLSSKFHQTSQYWIAVEIFIESRAGVATMARIRRIDKYHQRKYHSH